MRGQKHINEKTQDFCLGFSSGAFRKETYRLPVIVLMAPPRGSAPQRSRNNFINFYVLNEVDREIVKAECRPKILYGNAVNKKPHLVAGKPI